MFFPAGGKLSIICTTEDGCRIEAGMIGNEGLAGIPALMRVRAAPYGVVVQLAAPAQLIGVEALDGELRRGGQLQDLLLRYSHALLTQIAQSVSCGRFHTMEERLSRWLLTSRDRANSDSFRLTQEFLAGMLGTPRSSVTVVASALQSVGLIAYRRGRITILDRPAMEAASCECYRLVREGIRHFLAA